MANASTSREKGLFFESMKHFPSVINGRINIKCFLQASSDLVMLVERLGKVFAPVKYDMQGNVDKIKKFYEFDENSCLLELMLDETTSGKTRGAESVIWLNRALLFFELAFQEIIACLQVNEYDVSMKKVFTVAYEGSVKKYHNWVTQQIFTFICKMSTTLPQVMKCVEADKNVKVFETILTSYNIKLHLIRCKIDDFFREHDLFQDST